MLGFVGMDLLRGPNALLTGPSSFGKGDGVQLSNAIFDHFTLTHDTSKPFSTTIPTEWEKGMILNAPFTGNTNAGNLKLNIAGLDNIKIMRRIVGTSEWLYLTSIDINHSADKLDFAYSDTLAANNTEYEYAFVPVVYGKDQEYITNSIVTKFNGVFIGDAETTYRFLYDVEFGSQARNSPTGTFEPMGRKYPVIVSNGILSYETGSVSGLVMNDDYDETGVIDPKAIIAKRKALEDFLAKHTPKILKDWNGNIWLCMITGKIDTVFMQGSSMRIPKLSAEWAEIGDANNADDLVSSGLLQSETGGGS